MDPPTLQRITGLLSCQQQRQFDHPFIPSDSTSAFGEMGLGFSFERTKRTSLVRLLFDFLTNDSTFCLSALPAGTCFDDTSSLLNSETIPIVRSATAETHTQTHACKAGIGNPDTSDMCFFPSFPLSSTGFFFPTSVGGGEDYRQNPAESHQSTEGEL